MMKSEQPTRNTNEWTEGIVFADDEKLRFHIRLHIQTSVRIFASVLTIFHSHYFDSFSLTDETIQQRECRSKSKVDNATENAAKVGCHQKSEEDSLLATTWTI